MKSYGVKAGVYLFLACMSILIPVMVYLNQGSVAQQDGVMIFGLSIFLVLGTWALFVKNKLEFSKTNLILISLPIVIEVIMVIQLINIFGIGS